MDGKRVAAIGPGLLVLLGVKAGDGEGEAERMAEKLSKLRIFADADGKMNLNVRQSGGDVLVVSQFTVYGDTRKGNRPAFTEAAPPQEAEPLYQLVRQRLDAQQGHFGAHMHVSLTNDGPVTVLVET
jgi:D-aminoacyl-tRNA deacylase